MNMSVQGTGQKGADGNDGVAGDVGATGSQGIQGIQGDAGTDGADGATGSPGADGADGADGTNAATPAPAAYTLSTSHNITTTVSTIPFDVEEFDPDENYSNTAGEIAAVLAGYYHADINIPIDDDGSAGTTRGKVFAVLQRDQGSGTWIDVNNIRGQVYERELSGGTGLHLAGIVPLAASEEIRVRIDVSSTVDVSTESGEASINLHRIRGL